MSQLTVFDSLYCKYYDLLYSTKDYEGEVIWVSQQIKNYFPNASTLLDLGCGTGNHAVFFTQNGFSVTGVDSSDEMIKIAAEKNIKNFDPLVGEIENINLSKSFDSAVSLFHVLGYLSNNALENCFRLVNRHLNADGVFLFDVWFSPAVVAQKPEFRMKSVENELVQIERSASGVLNSSSNSVEVSYHLRIRDKNTLQINEIEEEHTMRHFGIEEIQKLATQSGFNVLDIKELLTGNIASTETWAVCFILQKVAGE